MSKAILELKKMKDPALMFDFVCAANYFAGNAGAKMPVEDSRQVYEKIVQLIIKKNKSL